jgi:hypothetical protein
MANKKSGPSTAQFFLGLGLAIFALRFPVFTISVLAICLIVALAGVKRGLEFLAGLAFAIFALMFPQLVLGTLLICIICIIVALAGKAFVETQMQSHSGS